MTITTNDVRDEYTASAAQTVFNYTFKIFADGQLNVYITPAGQEPNDSSDITTAYTIDPSSIGDEDGGFLTLDSGTTNGDRVTIVSDIPEARTTDYQNSGDFLPDVVNDDFDTVVSLVKQVEDKANRTLAFQNAVQNASGLTLPEPSAGLFMVWNGSETGLENSGVPSVVSPGGLSGTLTALKASTTVQIGDFVGTTGYNVQSDTGDNSYELVAGGTGTADDYTIIDLPGSGLQANALFPGGDYRLTQAGGALPSSPVAPPDWSSQAVSDEGMVARVPSQFATVPDAIAYVSRFLPQLAGTAIVALDSGFEWSADDNLLLEGVDLRMVRISSDDAVVNVAAGFTGSAMVAERSICPQWNINLDMLGLGNTGINLNENSNCYVGPAAGKGCVNAGIDGAFVNRQSQLYAHEGDFRGAARYGNFADHNSDIYGRHINLSGCLTNAKIRASSRASYGKFGSAGTAADLSGATGTGIEGNGLYAERGSVVECNGANIANCNTRGIRADEGAIVLAGAAAGSADVSGAPTGIQCSGNSRVYAGGIIAIGCSIAVSAAGGSYAQVSGGTLTGSALNSIVVDDDSKVDSLGADLSGSVRQATLITNLGGTVNESNIIHTYRKAVITVDSNDIGQFTTNEKIRVRMALDTDQSCRLAMNIRLAAGKSSSAGGRGGAAYVLISSGASSIALIDTDTTELQMKNFNTGEITLTHTGAGGEFDLEILNPNLANSSDWNWSLVIEVTISADDATNRVPNLAFFEAVVEL